MLATSHRPSIKPSESADGPATLRLAIIGLGNIGKIHLENLNQLKGAEVVSVVEPQAKNCATLPSRIRRCEHWSEIMSDSSLDAVIITLPHSLHAECAGLALQHGKHVFLEKPMATTLEDAIRLTRTSQETGKTLMVNMTHRFYPPLQIARRRLREGLVGKIITIHDHYMDVIDRAGFPSWFFDPHFAGGGVTITNSIHSLDRVSWLIDEPLQLKGQVSRHLDPQNQVEDCSELICQSRSGIPVTVGSFSCSGGAQTWADRLTIFGTKGTLVIQAWSHLEWTPHGQETQRIEGYPADLSHPERSVLGHRASMEEFLSAIRENRPPEATAASVLNAQEVVQNFYDHLSS